MFHVKTFKNHSKMYIIPIHYRYVFVPPYNMPPRADPGPELGWGRLHL